MGRLIRFFVFVACALIVAWFSIRVPLGKYTLWQHVARIWSTPEARELKEGIKKTATETSKQAIEDIYSSPKPPSKEKTTTEPAPKHKLIKPAGSSSKPISAK